MRGRDVHSPRFCHDCGILLVVRAVLIAWIAGLGIFP
jgi:hypothetical protein